MNATTDYLPEDVADGLLKRWVKRLSNVHLNDTARPAAVILSTPRSGSTWLMEAILSQSGFKPCDEPFNLRKQEVSRTLDLSAWSDLYDNAHLADMGTYLQSFASGKPGWGFKNLLPYENHHRFLTRRMVFKVLHGCEDLVPWLAETLGAKILFMMRHPLPVSISREVLPRLETLMSPPYSENFSDRQLQAGRTIVADGSVNEKAVLDWCLQNAVPLNKHRDHMHIVTYEQMVVEPDPVVDLLVRELELDSREIMMRQLVKPSGSTSKSTPETVSALQDQDNRSRLVEKWKPKVSTEEEKRLMDIVELFGIDAYRFGDCFPARHYWITSSD